MPGLLFYSACPARHDSLTLATLYVGNRLINRITAADGMHARTRKFGTEFVCTRL